MVCSFVWLAATRGLGFRRDLMRAPLGRGCSRLATWWWVDWRVYPFVGGLCGGEQAAADCVGGEFGRHAGTCRRAVLWAWREDHCRHSAIP